MLLARIAKVFPRDDDDHHDPRRVAKVLELTILIQIATYFSILQDLHLTLASDWRDPWFLQRQTLTTNHFRSPSYVFFCRFPFLSLGIVSLSHFSMFVTRSF